MDHNHVGSSADFARPIVSADAAPPPRRHTEDLRRCRQLSVHAGHAMRAQHDPQLLQKVAVVVDARLVDADRGADPVGLELVRRFLIRVPEGGWGEMPRYRA
ncbi:MAG: hypothetical protein J2P48_23130 [Alphaproteobacteria bacterium]|nr:hypothetical protein [Alphaproteobacteria bacterium]